MARDLSQKQTGKNSTMESSLQTFTKIDSGRNSRQSEKKDQIQVRNLSLPQSLLNLGDKSFRKNGRVASSSFRGKNEDEISRSDQIVLVSGPIGERQTSGVRERNISVGSPIKSDPEGSLENEFISFEKAPKEKARNI